MKDDSGDYGTDDHTGATIKPGTPVCSHCGTPIDTTEWYPIVTETTGTDSVILHSFCDEECQNAWDDGEP